MKTNQSCLSIWQSSPWPSRVMVKKFLLTQGTIALSSHILYLDVHTRGRDQTADTWCRLRPTGSYPNLDTYCGYWCDCHRHRCVSKARPFWVKWIAVHAIYHSLDPETSLALPVFHAFTGSDQTSFFAGRGKHTAREAWQMYAEVTSAFIALNEQSALEESMPSLYIITVCGPHVWSNDVHISKWCSQYH